MALKKKNFFGKGIQLDANLELSDETIRGKFSSVNPNWRGTDQSLIFNVQSSETDRIKTFGYKTTTTGFTVGTRFEYYEDLFLLPSISNYYESLKTSSTASSNLQKQRGTYFDTDFDYIIDYDKRNQKFQTTDGFRSKFSQSIPIVSDTNAISNGYEFNFYHEISDGMIGSFNFYSKTINSITGDDVRVSERLYMPTNKLRGFERGKIGPVDSSDYVGGNYVSAINLAATLPHFVPNVQNADFSVFYDLGNVWGVDYSSAVDESNKLRSAVGIAVDWYTPIGPLSFSYAAPLTKASTDKTETFRFKLGNYFLMKYLVKIFVIIIFLFCNNLSYAENLIVYIDMEKILNESKSGMSINKQLEKIHKMNIKEFKKIEDELKKKEESIIAQKNILSKEDYAKKIKILRDNTNSYRKNRQEKINLLTKKRMESSSKLLSIINPILSDYSKVNNISIILQKKNVVLAKTDLNITNKIIDILNSKIESINLN